MLTRTILTLTLWLARRQATRDPSSHPAGMWRSLAYTAELLRGDEPRPAKQG